MIINPDILRKETIALLKQIDAQIDEVKTAANARGLRPEQMRDSSGSWVMSPLLLAKAQAHASLVLLQSRK